MPRLDRDRRVEMVGALRSVGMSTRAIGSATGTSHETARKDAAAAGVQNLTPDERPEPSAPPANLGSGRAFDQPVVPEPAPEPISAPEPEPKVTGTDGKQYPARA